MRERMRLCAGMLLAVGASGCALISAVPQSELDETAASIARSRVAAVVDGCVLRDEVGRDYALASASELAGALTQQRLRNAAATQGLTLQTSLRPFFCGGLSARDSAGLEAARAIGGSALDQSLPLDGADLPAAGPLRDAYHALLQSSYRRLQEPRRRRGEPYPRLGLSARQLGELRQDLNAEIALVAFGLGGSVSGAKSVGQAVLTGLISAVLTGGQAIGSSTTFDGSGYWIAVVDLTRGSLLWSQQSMTRDDPTQRDSYPAKWSQAMLNPLFEGAWRTRLATAPVVQPVAPPRPAAVDETARPGQTDRDPVATPTPAVARFGVPADIELRAAAAPDATVTARLARGEIAQRQRSVRLPDGEWWFVSAAAGQGWMRAPQAQGLAAAGPRRAPVPAVAASPQPEAAAPQPTPVATPVPEPAASPPSPRQVPPSIVAGRQVTLQRPLGLRYRAAVADPERLSLPAGRSVQLVGGRDVEGIVWWYLRAGPDGGWVTESRLRTATGIEN